MKKKVNKEFVEDGAANIEEDDIRKAAENAEKIEEKVKNSSKLRKFMSDFKLLGSLVKDYTKGNYRSIPYKAIAVIVFTLLYVLNVADIIPDFIPGIGLLDDASVIAFCLKIVNTEITKYRVWKDDADSIKPTLD
jgi:uncharacterized membrane protein YkvA (DUF1232 family)